MMNRYSKLLMMPHSDAWECCVTAVIVMHVVYVMLLYCYLNGPIYAELEVLNYALEMVFFAEVAFNIIHRNFSSHKSDICIRRTPFIILFLNFISLIPLYEIYKFILFGSTSVQMNVLFKMKVFLRIPQIFFFFAMKRSEAAINEMFFLFFYQISLVLIYVTLLSTIFYSMGCYGCATSNWMKHLNRNFYDHGRFIDRAFVPFTYIAGLVVNTSAGVIKPETEWELALIVICIVLSYMVALMTFQSHLIAHAIFRHMKRYTFNNRLQNIYYYMKLQRIDKHLQQRIKEFYNAFWHQRQAVAKMPKAFKLLPLSLQKDIMLDIFWDALIHSRLFRHTSLTFKRDVCMRMTSEFLLPGDYVYEPLDIKSKLIYIASGIVQMLSEEDEESPVISFSSGTVLSEISCLMVTRSDCRLRCATYCELHVLSLANFFRFLSSNRNHTRDCLKSLQERIRTARSLNDHKFCDGRQNLGQDRPIRRIKTRWRFLQQEQYPGQLDASLKFLDLIVLSDEMDLKVEAVCLTHTFPVIFNPDSSFRYFCDMLCLGAVCLETLIIPYSAAFQRNISTELTVVLLILDSFYLLDVALQLTTAIKDRDHFVVRFSDILLGRIKQFTFQIDVLATIPYDYVSLITGRDPQLFILLKIPRILKCYKLIALIHSTECKLGTNIRFIKMFKWLVIHLLSVYISTCFLYMTSCFYAECFKTSWFAYNKHLSLFIDNRKRVTDVVRTMYVATSLLERSGSGENVYDQVIMTVMMYVGYVIASLAISDLVATEYWAMHDQRGHKILLYSMLKYARIHKLQDKLLYRIDNMLGFRWDYNRDQIKRDAMEIFYEMPGKLRESILDELIVKCLVKTVLFADADDWLLKKIASISELIAFPKNSYITIRDRLISHVYIVKRGYCSCDSIVPGDRENGTNVRILETGDVFPIVEVLHRVQCFITVRAMTSVDAIIIPYHRMLNYMKTDERFYAHLMTAVQQHYAENKSIISRLPCRMRFRVERPAREYGTPFVYERPASKGDDVIVNEASLWTMTINPNTTWYYAYEMLRCLLALLEFVIIIGYANIFYQYYEEVQIVNLILDGLCYIDILIKAKLRYFNQNGALVTNAHDTLWNYVRHSFYLDVWAAFPFKTLKVSWLFPSEKRFALEALMLLISRPFQLYRVMLGIDYLCARAEMISQMNATRILTTLKILIIVAVVANVLMLMVCEYDAGGYHCKPQGWIEWNIDVNTRWSVLLYLYIITCYLTHTLAMIPGEFNETLIYFYLAVTIFFLLVFWTFLSQLVSYALHEELMTSQLQNDRLNFKAYARNESLQEQYITSTLQTNEYLTRSLESCALEMAEKRFTPQLNEDLAFAFNRRAMHNAQLLHFAPEYLLRALSGQMSRRFYRKDGIIVRHNDVHDKIFLVKRGKVEISIANTKLTNFSHGGMFGCFTRLGYWRQTTMARAALHTEVLIIRNADFYRSVSMHARTKQLVDEFTATHLEYSMPQRIEDEQCSDTVTMLDDAGTNNACIEGYSRLINRIFNQTSKMFLCYDYLLNVHLSVFSVVFVLVYQMLSMQGRQHFGFNVTLYILDIIFSIRIFLGFSLSYVDETSGLVIKNCKSIVKRYLSKSFALDFLSVSTPELYFAPFIEDSFQQALLTSNRLLRIIYLLRYYNYYKKHNLLTHNLRWTYLVYVFVVYMQFFTNLWIYIACYRSTCYYRATFKHARNVYLPSEPGAHTNILAYLFVADQLSFTGLRIVIPMELPEVNLTSLLQLSSIFMTGLLCSGFAMIRIIDNWSLGRYMHEMDDMHAYLENHKLSPVILHETWYYYLMLWKTRSGEQLPALVKHAPMFIREDIMCDIYLHHLENHCLFKHTHVDFKRQLLVHAHLRIFPSRYVIVERGEVDNCMYFVHAGTVSVVERGECSVDELFYIKKNESFGEIQGLSSQPHQYTYIAHRFAQIIILNKNDWDYLLKFFPASVDELRQKVSEYYVTELTDL